MSYKPSSNSLLFGAYLNTSQSLPLYTVAQSINYQLDYDTAVKSCVSESDVIKPDYPHACVFADVCMYSSNGYYAYSYGFSEGHRTFNALVGRNEQQRDDVSFDIITTSARLQANYVWVSSGATRTLDPNGLNQMAGFFI